MLRRGGINMKKRVAIILISIITGLLLISGGYATWNEALIIQGYITVVKPKPVQPTQSVIVEGEALDTVEQEEIQGENVDEKNKTEEQVEKSSLESTNN